MMLSRSLRWLLPLYFAITLPLAFLLNLWIDEAYTLDTTQLPFWQAGQQAIDFENQPPLYFVLLALWRTLHPSIGFARLFSVACIGITVILAGLLARRYCPKVSAVWVMGAVALNPYCIWAATEIRAYGFAVLLSALLLLFFYDGYLQEGDSQWRLWHGITAIAALYTHYFLGSLLIAQGVTLLFTRRWRSLRAYSFVMGLVSLAFIPMLFALSSHLASQGSGMDLQTDTTLETLRAMLGRSLRYLWPSEFLPQELRSLSGLRYGGLLGIGGLTLLYRKRLKLPQIALGITVGTCFAVLTLVLDMTDNASLAARYSYPLFVPLLLSVFAVVSLLQQRLRARVLVTWGAIALVCYGGSLLHQYSLMAKDGDWERVANFIQSQEQAEQPIVVFSAEGVLPLKYHYHGINPLVSLPAQESSAAYSLRRFVIQDESEIQQAFQQVAISSPESLPESSPEPRPESLPKLWPELWLVEGPKYVLEGTGDAVCEIWGIDLNCAALSQFVQNHYRIEQQKEFYGSQVQRLVAKTPKDRLAQVDNASEQDGRAISSSPNF